MSLIPGASGTATTLTDGATLGSGTDVLSTYQLGTTSSTFTFNGSGGTSGAITLTYTRIGNVVTLNMPAVTATSGTTSTSFTGNTAIAAFARPTNTQRANHADVVNNNATVAAPGYLTVTSAGVVTLNRDGAGTAWTNATTCGTGSNYSFTYYIA